MVYQQYTSYRLELHPTFPKRVYLLDYEGDGDMDDCVPHFENEIDEEHLEYQILVNKELSVEWYNGK